MSMLPDLRTFAGTMGTPLLGGDRGVAQTIDLMRQLVDDAVKDPLVNRTAIEMVRGVSDSFSRDAKAQVIYTALAQSWTYVEDPVGPFGPKETLRPVRALLQMLAGDCDDASLLIASLLGTIGIPSRFVTIAADPTAPNEFSHIYPEAETTPGNWMAMDIARPGSAYGVAPQRFYRKRVWPLDDQSPRDVLSGGCKCGESCCQRASSLNGYAVLGQPYNTAAEDISAVGQSVANVISASHGNPYGAFATPYSPGAIVPGAGYPGVLGPTAQITATGSSMTWIVGGLALLALLMSRRGGFR